MKDLLAASAILFIVMAVSIASFRGGERNGIDIGITKGKQLCAPDLDCPHRTIVVPTYNTFGLPEFYEYEKGHFNPDHPEHYFTLEEWAQFKEEMRIQQAPPKDTPKDPFNPNDEV
jgi:hypothetical protein